MPWTRIDDRIHSHRKFKRVSNDAIALWLLALSYCGDNLTDGRLTDTEVERLLAERRMGKEVVAELTGAPSGEEPLWHRVEGGYAVHDYLDYNPSREHVLREREWAIRRKELYADPELMRFIRGRDRDRCRYCGRQVNWKDRRGAGGGTYDHVVPRGPTTADNLVVACRGCNSAKGGHAPAERGMRLLAPGSLGTGDPNGAGTSRSELVPITPESSHPVPVPDPVPDLDLNHESHPERERVHARTCTPSRPLAHESIATDSIPPTDPGAADANGGSDHAAEPRSLWAALEDVLGYSPKTDGERAKWGRGIGQLMRAKVAPDHIAELVARYRARFGDIACNPAALANNLGSLQAFSPVRPATGQAGPRRNGRAVELSALNEPGDGWEAALARRQDEIKARRRSGDAQTAGDAQIPVASEQDGSRQGRRAVDVREAPGGGAQDDPAGRARGSPVPRVRPGVRGHRDPAAGLPGVRGEAGEGHP
jgi:hypothetical protein